MAEKISSPGEERKEMYPSEQLITLWTLPWVYHEKLSCSTLAMKPPARTTLTNPGGRQLEETVSFFFENNFRIFYWNVFSQWQTSKWMQWTGLGPVRRSSAQWQRRTPAPPAPPSWLSPSSAPSSSSSTSAPCSTSAWGKSFFRTRKWVFTAITQNFGHFHLGFQESALRNATIFRG